MQIKSVFALISLLAQSAIAVGENCSSPTSLWDMAACPVFSDTTKYQALCKPVRAFPYGATNYASLKTGVKGVIVIYHGYTACPDAASNIVPRLQAEGYVVLVPLIVGQGVKVGYGCTTPDACSPNKDPIAFLPIAKEPYISWLDWSLQMVAQEAALIPTSARASTFFVGSLGLSLGGAMATLSASRPGTPIKRAIAVNPFHASTIPPLDFNIYQCQTDPNPAQCLSSFLGDFSTKTPVQLVKNFALTNGGNYTALVDAVAKLSPTYGAILNTPVGNTIVSGYDQILDPFWAGLTVINDTPLIQNNSLLLQSYSWGDECIKRAALNPPVRGGYCDMKVRNLMAIHAFGSFAVGKTQYIPATSQYDVILAGRDGIAADGIATALVSQLGARGVKTSKCTFAIGCSPRDTSVSPDNTCGVPHSCFSKAENILRAPYSLYWEPAMLNNIVAKFRGDQVSYVTTVNRNKDVCSNIPNPMLSTKLIDLGKKFLSFTQGRYK